MLIRRAVNDFSLLEIEDELTREVYYGCRQEWYATSWKRLSGCGPSVVSTIMNYILRSRGTDAVPAGASWRATKNEMKRLMDDVWMFVTPTMRGIPNTKILRDGIDRYVSHHALGLDADELIIPKLRELRPPLGDVVTFLETALEWDIPVAFLSLDNGEEKALDTWHWVALVSVTRDTDADSARIEVLDECRLFEADLRKWYETTAVGGGFVRLRPR
ncbi:MAG: hypothetical protein LBS51_00130 [Oscillospiraceae bacterium]|nr:hypothetical protein [Oscillospiraceae bacterium]